MGDDNSSDIYVSSLRTLYFVISIMGLIFTSTLLFILINKLKKSRHSDIVLTFVAVSVDCVASGGLLFRAIFSKYPYNIFQAHYNWCAYDTMINNTALTYSGYVLSILSVQRMLLIVFNIRLSIIIWLSIEVVLYILLWSQLLYHTIINNVTVSAVEIFCLVKNVPSANPFFLTILVCTTITYILTIISYITIIIFSCKQCLKQLDLNLDKSTVYRECRTIVFKSLFFIIPYMLIYSGRIYCWFYQIITGEPRTWTMDYVSNIQVSTCVVVNCLTILYMNKEVNTDFTNFLVKFKKGLVDKLMLYI